MALDEDLRRIERELSGLNLGGLMTMSNQINILDIGISQTDQTKIDQIKEYLLDLTGKKININVLNYDKFIEDILGMSFETYSNKIRDILDENKMNFSKAIKYTENLLETTNSLPQGNFWINYSVSQILLLANKGLENTPRTNFNNLLPVSILHPVIAKMAKTYAEDGVSLTEFGDFDSTLKFPGAEELKESIKNLYLKQELMRFDKDNYRTAVDFLIDVLSRTRHAIGASQNKQFIEHLIKEYNKETQQSLFPVKFGFVSYHLKSKNGKLEVINPDEIGTTDLNQYGAIFIDNDYRFSRMLEPLKKKDGKEDYFSKLGKGIVDLEKIAAMKKIPPIIFYQTAHNLEHISEEDKERVENLAGAILLPKNVAPKFSFEKNMAEKEIEITKLLEKYEEVFQYTAQTLQVNDAKPFVREVDGKEYFITLSKSALTQKINEDKRIKTLKENNLQDNAINTKMYVLSMFHEALKSQINNPVFQGTNHIDFFEYEDIENKVLPSLAQNLNEYKQTYNSIIEKHRLMTPTTISHNDTKWDNWFGKILGDYGQASAGTEYKDVARSLFDREVLENNKIITKKTIDTAIDAYITLRKKNSENFEVDVDEFRQNVYEMVFVESLRLARYESMQKSEKLAQGLLTNAKYMHNLITDNFKQHAQILDSIEYNKKFTEENLDIKLQFLHDCLVLNFEEATPKLNQIMEKTGNTKITKEITDTYNLLRENAEKSYDRNKYDTALAKIRDLILPK